MAKVFEREVAVFPVMTGTAANALALSTLCPHHGAILCHDHAHIAVDECGAPEFFTHGAKLVPSKARTASSRPSAIERALKSFQQRRRASASQPAVISITQATECGTVYSLQGNRRDRGRRKATRHEAAHGRRALRQCAGASGCTPAEMTWKAGVDVLSFGATKNGALVRRSRHVLQS